jgi:hypothetical protein
MRTPKRGCFFFKKFRFFKGGRLTRSRPLSRCIREHAQAIQNVEDSNFTGSLEPRGREDIPSFARKRNSPPSPPFSPFFWPSGRDSSPKVRGHHNRQHRCRSGMLTTYFLAFVHSLAKLQILFKKDSRFLRIFLEAK